jgi:hypothetical protein
MVVLKKKSLPHESYLHQGQTNTLLNFISGIVRVGHMPFKPIGSTRLWEGVLNHEKSGGRSIPREGAYPRIR